MSIIISIFIVCVALLFAQYRSQEHERFMEVGKKLLWKLEERVSLLEKRKIQEFDPSALEDLKSKVEAIRIAQGLRR